MEPRDASPNEGPGPELSVGNQAQDSSSPPETQTLRGKGSVSDSIDASIKQTLLEQLYFTKIDDRLTNLGPAQKGTCNWFLSKPEYTAWRDMA